MADNEVVCANGDAADSRRLGLLTSLFDIRGKCAVVTGGASGIGEAIAVALATVGAEVTIADVDARSLAAAAARMADAGLAVRTHLADVGEAAQMAELFETVSSQVGVPEIVFANAGISGGPGPSRPGGQIGDVDLVAWEATIRTNLTGAMLTIQAASRAMTGGGGRIIVTASVAAFAGDAIVAYSYVASKAAVANLVRQAAIDLAPRGILVNAIAPGPFRTNIGPKRTGCEQNSASKDWMERQFASRIPLQRVADPSEMQGLALYLASPASAFVTGAVFAIDGGSSAGRN